MKGGGRWATSLAVSVVSNPALTNVPTAITSFVLTPLLEVLLLVSVVASVGSADLRDAAYASVLLAFGLAVLTGAVAQVTRDRQLGVLQDVLSFGPWNLPYWFGKVVPPVLLGATPAVLGCVAIYLLDPSHDAHALKVAVALAPLLALSGALVGVTAAVLSIALSDPYVISNVAHWTLLVTAGVVLPIALYPTWLATIALALPFTAGIEGVRSGEPSLALVGREIAVSTSWFLLGALSARRVLASMRSGRHSVDIW